MRRSPSAVSMDRSTLGGGGGSAGGGSGGGRRRADSAATARVVWTQPMELPMAACGGHVCPLDAYMPPLTRVPTPIYRCGCGGGVVETFLSPRSPKAPEGLYAFDMLSDFRKGKK